MRRLHAVTDLMYDMMNGASERGVLYRDAQDNVFDGRTLTIDGKTVLHFGACSYLGLELHPA